MAQSIKNFAKKLLVISLANGRLSEEKISDILKTLRSNPPRHYREILEAYLIKVRSELRKENAIIEYAGSLEELVVTEIKNDLKKYYNRDISVTMIENPKLLAGLRISVADDVWDFSVSGRLKQLQKSL